MKNPGYSGGPGPETPVTRVGYRGGVSVNSKRQPGKGDGTKASNAARDGAKVATSDGFPSSVSTNKTDRIRPEAPGQDLRGYVQVAGSPQSTRKVGVTIKKIGKG